MAIYSATSEIYTTATTSASTGSTDGVIWTNWMYISNLQLAQGTGTYNSDTIWFNWTTTSSGTVDASYDQETSNYIWSSWTIAQPEVVEVVTPRIDFGSADKSVERAKALLMEHLSEKQKKQLIERGEFVVKSKSGKHYAITKGRAGNVFSLDEHRKRVNRYCIHPTDYVPDYDTMLSQMIWLKWNEEEFLKVANVSRAA